MTKAVAPIPDLKVQRHCAFDTFVSRVDQRTKHASGLAIHVSNPTDPAPRRPLAARDLPKSQYYLQIEREIKDRAKGNQDLKRNQEAKKHVAQEIDQMLRNFQKTKAKNTGQISSNLWPVDIPPDPQLMAQFRVRWLVGPSSKELFPEAVTDQ
jgi:type IV secretory pathway VirB4 component